MCHVDGMKVAKKPLLFPAPFDKICSAINKVIDSHIRSHKDTDCKKKYDPVKLKEQLPGLNTMAAEQTFVWLARFKKILCFMPKTHHLFLSISIIYLPSGARDESCIELFCIVTVTLYHVTKEG